MQTSAIMQKHADRTAHANRLFDRWMEGIYVNPLLAIAFLGLATLVISVELYTNRKIT